MMRWSVFATVLLLAHVASAAESDAFKVMFDCEGDVVAVPGDG